MEPICTNLDETQIWGSGFLFLCNSLESAHFPWNFRDVRQLGHGCGHPVDERTGSFSARVRSKMEQFIRSGVRKRYPGFIPKAGG